jgi:hypothetical protein
MAMGPDGRQPTSRLQGYRALGVGVLVTVAVMLLVAAVGGGSGHGSSSASSATDITIAPGSAPGTTVPVATSASTSTSASGTATTTAPTTTTGADPGVLPQTETRPDPTSAVFIAHANALWAAIVANDPAPAMPFFFPLSAYKQVKSISDPEHDWNTRLVAAFTEDVHAWHAQLGANAASAQLTGVAVPTDQAQWIQPGVESNKGSYWRVYGTTLRYQVDGRAGTFTVASMISWRGEWYVVHLASIR